MTEDDHALSDFGLGATMRPPRVRRKAIKKSPTTGKIAGFVGKETARGNGASVYTTLRGRSHYYYDGGGWAISDSILRDIQRLKKPVARILVHDGTSHRDDVYEFAARQYYDGIAVPEYALEDEDDPQTYVKEEDARHVWEGHAAALFERSFEQALNDIQYGRRR